MRLARLRIPAIHHSQPAGRAPRPGNRSLRSLLVMLAIVIPLALPDSTAASSSEESSLQETLQPLIEAKMKELRVPGAVLYVQAPGKGAWKAALGTGNLTTGAPIRLDDRLRIGSITKTFTATIILQLVDEGKLKFDDLVSKYQPEVPNGSSITIRQLLNMTSGLYDYVEDKGLNEKIDAEPGKVWQPKQLLTVAFHHQPYFAPGKGIHYTNTNYILLGLMIEQITGKPVEHVFHDRIFGPLGMTETSMPPRSSAAIPNPHPRGYMFGTRTEIVERPLSAPLTPEQAAKVNVAAGMPNDVTDANPSWGWTAGSVISTLHDVNIWAKALATGTLLSPTSQRERIIRTMALTPGGPSYGLGIMDFDGFRGHNGGIPGFQSWMGYQPGKHATVIVLTNLLFAPDGAGPADYIAKDIREHLQ
ncbi:serine hydrolase domain-containing protein [Nitrolancea hollandica]|uniref:Beta-lactamase n=1 Tax=Nitrolancea hollandica Lb TaxID=1129897 RepID=I4ELX1_9BACT|nr:serine hydrolase domain-containing protein [Nitrolancea hollandica]CCF85684.1 Beta-lactamase [Nitrolancea hollandica Lb]